MAKSTLNPKNIQAKVGGKTTRSSAFVNMQIPPKRVSKSDDMLKNKKPGNGLDDYSLDLMKLS